MNPEYGAAAVPRLGRPADPVAEGFISVGLLAVGFLIVQVYWLLVNGLSLYGSALALGFGVVLSAVILAAIIGFRARSPRRRLWAWACVAGAFGIEMVSRFALGAFTYEYATTHPLLLAVLSWLPMALDLTAWGIARRFGRAWVLALVLSPVILVVMSQLQSMVVMELFGAAVPLVLAIQVSAWFHFIGYLLAGALCWGVDVLTTKPVSQPAPYATVGPPPGLDTVTAQRSCA